MGRFALLAAVSLALGGCSSSATEEQPPVIVPPCDAQEIAMSDGSCLRPGIPLDGCADGFVHDDEYGCEPILPSDPCPDGFMALPGEDACRSIMACGRGRWGDIPVDAATVYVDGNFTGGGNDGSAARPWVRIQDAVNVAARGALVAIAAGTYTEDVQLDTPVRLWGVCPERVELVAAGVELAALTIVGTADASEVVGLAIRSTTFGLVMSGVQGVIVDRVWIHDTAGTGLHAEGTLGPTSFTVKGSLVERASTFGILVKQSVATIEATTVRATQPDPGDASFGRGIHVQLDCDPTSCNAATRATAEVRGSVIEDNHDIGVFVMGSDATIEGSIIRRTLPEAIDDTGGRGVGSQVACTLVGCDPTSRGNVTLRGSLVDANHEIGLFVDGSDAHVETSIIRGTLPRATTLLGGRGVNIQVPCLADVCDPSARSNATLLASLIEQNHEAGVFVMGSEINMEASVVRDNLPRELDQSWGRGMSIQRCVADGCDLDSRSLATLHGVLIENNREFGMLVSASDATIDSVTVRGTLARASDGNQGDGIAVSSQYVPSTASIVGTHVHDNARAGIGNFSSVVDLASTSVACNQLDLVASHCCIAEPVFRDGGGNVCGCPEGAAGCKSTSTELIPPDALPPPE